VAAAAQEAQRSYRVNPRWLRALALHGDPRDLELLITASRSESWVEQRAAVEALGACARTEALTRLLAVFRDEQSPYQTAAGDALALRAGEVDPRGPPAGTVLAALAGDLQAARPADRARTVYWLARLPASAAAEPLLKALADPEAPIRQLADWALRRVTGKDAGFDAQAPPK
jgi:HEAT repeat protein